MKTILRIIFIIALLVLFWPFLLFKRYGKKDISFDDNSLIIANHYSNFDAFYLYLIIKNKKRIHFVVNLDAKKHFLSRTICSLFNCVYFDTKNTLKNVNSSNEIVNILNNGGVVIIFPEGIINATKHGILEFQKGFIYFARKANSKIYPLYIDSNLYPFKLTKIFINDGVYLKDIKVKTDLELIMYFQTIIIDSLMKMNGK